jgi:hypothetical protein
MSTSISFPENMPVYRALLKEAENSPTYWRSMAFKRAAALVATFPKKICKHSEPNNTSYTSYTIPYVGNKRYVEEFIINFIDNNTK